MGVAPPPDNPPPTETPDTDFGSSLGPPVASLCGFTIPSLPNFVPGFSLPIDALDFPPSLPIPKLPLSIDCSSSNPQDISKGVAFGGGRVSNADPSPDLNEDSS